MDEWSERYAELQKKVLSPSDMSEFLLLVRDKIEEIEAIIKESETCIVIYAEEPASDVFRLAVAKHRTAISTKDAYGKLMTRIETVIDLEV